MIPPRRNKFGKRFGFTRFAEVVDGRILGVKLDNIVVDGKKIHVNLPRYARSNQVKGDYGGVRGLGITREERRFDHQRRDGVNTNKATSLFNKEGSRSFADVVKLGNICSHLSFNTSIEGLVRFKKAFIGVTVNHGMSYNIQTSLEVEGYFSIKVTPLGENLCLLEDIEVGAISDLIKEGRVTVVFRD